MFLVSSRIYVNLALQIVRTQSVCFSPPLASVQSVPSYVSIARRTIPLPFCIESNTQNHLHTQLVYWHIHFQTNDAEYFFIDKATERGDAVASSIEVNAVQWENRQVN